MTHGKFLLSVWTNECVGNPTGKTEGKLSRRKQAGRGPTFFKRLPFAEHTTVAG